MTLTGLSSCSGEVQEAHQTLQLVRQPDGRRLRNRGATIEIFKIFKPQVLHQDAGLSVREGADIKSAELKL
jgi:hypothetical protein